MTRSYRAVALLEDPGELPTVRIGGRERPLLTALLTPVLVIVKFLRLSRRRRAVQREIDRIASELERDLPSGTSHPEFQDRVIERLRAWAREHPPSL